jgi:hypothetical protein
VEKEGKNGGMRDGGEMEKGRRRSRRSGRETDGERVSGRRKKREKEQKTVGERIGEQKQRRDGKKWETNLERAAVRERATKTAEKMEIREMEQRSECEKEMAKK